MVIKMERQLTEWEKIFVTLTSEKQLIGKICCELSQLYRKKIEFKNEQRLSIDFFPKTT